MANKKLTDLTELTTPADNDFLYIVDVSDTTESAQGTSKKIRKDKVDSGASKENIANKQNDLTPDGTGTKYPTVDAVNNALPISYSKIVYVNATSPTTATIFDLENPPVTNDNLLKNDTANLYIGTDASTWVYLTGTGYVTKTVTSATSNFNTFGTTVDAGNSKTSHITRSGPVTLTGSLNLAFAKISTTPNTSAGSYDILTRNSSTTALEKKLVSDFVQIIGNQSVAGQKTFTDAMSIKSMFASSGNTTSTIYVDNASTGAGIEGRNFTNGIFINALPNNGKGFVFDLVSGTTGIGGVFNSANTASGNLLEFKKNNTNTTVISHLGEITTMSPTASGQVSTKGYVDAKITQTITNGVTDKSPSEDAVFDATFDAVKTIITDTPTSTNTGGVSEVLMHTYTIAGGKLPTICNPNLKVRVSKSGTVGTYTLRVKVNTTNNFATATTIATYTGAANTNTYLVTRNPILISGNMEIPTSGTASLISDETAFATAFPSITYDTTITQYWFVSLQNSDATDTTRIRSVKLIN